MTTLRRRMLEDLQLRGLAPKTQPCDVAAVHQLAQHDRRPPDQRSEAELRQYVRFLLHGQQGAESTFRIHLYGMRFFYERTLKRPWPIFDLVRPRKSQKLPVVVSPQEVRHLLALVKNLKAQMCRRLIYACGLRLREGSQLQVSDIDPQRMLVRVRQGNGGKDRCVPLAPRVLELLRAVLAAPAAPPLGIPGPAAVSTPVPHLPATDVQRGGAPAWDWQRCLRPVPCGTPMRPICWNGEYRCGSSRSCSATRASRPPPATPI